MGGGGDGGGGGRSVVSGVAVTVAVVVGSIHTGAFTWRTWRTQGYAWHAPLPTQRAEPEILSSL